MPTIEDLRYFQRLPLDIKVAMTKTRIREWVNRYGVNGVYISFSGGKDSTVLLHIARQDYPDIKAVFVDTGLEYPEIKQFVRTHENVEIVRPKKTFKQVICEYGYPMITKKVSKFIGDAQRGVKYALDYVNLEGSAVRNGKISKWNVNRYKDLLNADFRINNKCCDVMKKNPAFTYQRENQRKPLTAQMAAESEQREHNWLRFGCNMFDAKHPISNPMSFWTEQDVLQYIRDNKLPIASVYGDIVYEDTDGQTRFEGCGKLCTTGCTRTGW
jgi:3'-phosphoadenosine 5'-phosphosulfate sulfotransferase (PAPS reductase)/FAD synthetase